MKDNSNGKLTIVWQPYHCLHARSCWRGTNSRLPEVFNPRKKPWIKPESADTGRIITQIARCPSGALSHFRDHTKATEYTAAPEPIVEVMPKGALLAYGDITVKNGQGNETRKTRQGHFTAVVLQPISLIVTEAI